MPDFLGQGIHTDVDSAVYFADPCVEPSLTQSFGKMLLNQSPAHVRMAHPRLNPNRRPEDDEEKYEKARAIGNAAHTLVLGRGKPLGIIDAKDFRGKAAQAERDAAIAAGKSPILAKHYAVAEAIRDAARPQLDMAGCSEAFRSGAAEVVMIAYDEEYGIWLRTMADWVVNEISIYDLKTGEQSAAPHMIPRRMVNDGWDVQAAMQERILDILVPKYQGKRTFRFVAIENEEPCALTVNELPESVMEFGRRKLRSACEIWRDCMASGQWPAYPPMVYRPEMPGYAETQWLNRELEESDRRSIAARKPLDLRVMSAG